MNALHTHGQEQGHGQGHGHAHGPHGHRQVEAPPTEGLLIRQARFYDLRVGLMFLGRLGSLRKLSLDLAALRPGDHVLDVGCGTGALALRAARRVGPTGIVWGIDAAPEMVEVARVKARRRRNAARFQVAAVERMPFPDASFDVVLSSLMMHQLPGELRLRALAEIKRVLRPGGRVLLVDFQHTAQLPRPWEPGWLLSRRHKLHAHAGMQFRPAGAGLGDLLREAGYEGVESGPTRYGWIVYARGRVPA